MTSSVLSSMPPPTPSYEASSPFSDPLMSADSVLRCLATAVVSWLIIGALGYGNWSSPEHGIPLDMLVGVFLVIVQSISLIAATSPAAATWPHSSGVYATSAILGFGVTTSGAILFHKFAQHAYLGLFWSLGGIYLGLAVEGVTGVVHRARAVLAGTAEAQVMGPKRS